MASKCLIISHNVGTWKDKAPKATFGERSIFNNSKALLSDLNPAPFTAACNQITSAPPVIEDGYSNLGEVQMANDLMVPANKSFTMESLSFNSMVEPGIPVKSVDVYYYNDTGNGPGTLIGSELGITPSNIENHGIVNNHDHLTVTVDFDSPFEFQGNSFTTIYWVAIKISIGNTNGFMEVTTTNVNTTYPVYVFNPNTQTFVPGPGEFGDGVLSMFGNCEDIAACSGTPSAGTVQGPNEICSDTEFLLEVTGATRGQSGLTYKWQIRESGGSWEDLGGATNFSLYKSITTDTDYRFVVQCGSSSPVYSADPLTITLKPTNECHCIPVFTNGCNQFGDYIKNFILEGKNGTGISDLGTTCPTASYDDRTNQSVELATGFEYVAQISSGSTDDFVAVWIDFNNNGSFETDEIVGSVGSVSGTQKSLTLNIPADAPEGHFRMRVFLQYWQMPVDPCVPDAPWGMVRDYSVDIIGSVDCSGQPDAGTAVGPDSICPNSEIVLSVSGVTQASGVAFHWESSPQGQNDWTTLPDSNTLVYIISEGITEATDFRFYIECSFSGESDTSNVVSIDINAPTDCYCEPEYVIGCDFDGVISSVRFKNANGEVVFENQTGCSVDGYGDYTSVTPANLEQGKTYTIEIQTGSPDPINEDLRAWVDFGQDGIFDNDEEIANTLGNGFPSNGLASYEFTVPANQDLGDYRLRIRLHSFESNSEIDPCEKYTYGEAEDYFVSVVEPMSVNDYSFNNFNIYPNPVQNQLNLKSDQIISEVILYNLLGQQLIKISPKSQQTQLDVSSLSAGTYILKAVVNGNEKSFKIVKF